MAAESSLLWPAVPPPHPQNQRRRPARRKQARRKQERENGKADEVRWFVIGAFSWSGNAGSYRVDDDRAGFTSDFPKGRLRLKLDRIELLQARRFIGPPGSGSDQIYH